VRIKLGCFGFPIFVVYVKYPDMKIVASLFLSIVCMICPAIAQIEAGNSVIIKILGVTAEEKAKIDETYPVSNKGTVNMPFVGEVRAAGLESDELAKSIQSAYRDGGIYTNATIQVISTKSEGDAVSQQVHIGGQVRAPGPRPFTKGLTVFQAIQAAGGATEFGAMNRVILWREGAQTKIDLSKAEGMAIVTEPKDTIEVKQKNGIGR
jgi:polysaccharide export outer membrane protein